MTTQKKINKKKSSTSLVVTADDANLDESGIGGLDDVGLVDEVIDEHPLPIGASLAVKYRDGSSRLAKIIERNSNLDDFKYYVHYIDFNRRMDEWINIDRILKYPSEIELDTSNNNTSIHIHSSTDQYSSAPTTIKDDEHDEHEGMDAAALVEHEEVTKIKNIRQVSFGKFNIESWYFSPYPEEIWSKGPVDVLYICEFTFRFFCTKFELVRHLQKSNLQRHPPGNEIYRDSNVSMFEIDGATERLYCQNLCYFAKLFLDHKTLYWDVEPFLFYVLCTYDNRGYHPVGYFSKEKYSDLGFNLACILAFPFAQRKSYGKFLIRFSYELSKKEEKLGSPEKPLSDLGAVSYKSYWAWVLLTALKVKQSLGVTSISIAELSYATSMLAEDIIPVLKSLNILVEFDSDQTSTNISTDNCLIYLSSNVLDELLAKYEPKGLTFDPRCLQWIPLYVVDPSIDKWSIQYHKSKATHLSSSASTALTSNSNMTNNSAHTASTTRLSTSSHGKGKGSLNTILHTSNKKEGVVLSRVDSHVTSTSTHIGSVDYEEDAMDIEDPEDSASSGQDE